MKLNIFVRPLLMKNSFTHGYLGGDPDGDPVCITVDVTRNEQTGAYVGRGSNLTGLFAEAPTIEELRKNINSAIKDLRIHELH